MPFGANSLRGDKSPLSFIYTNKDYLITDIMTDEPITDQEETFSKDSVSNMTIAVIIAILVLGAIFIPVINNVTSHTETVHVVNDNAEVLKLGYKERVDYDFVIDWAGETVTIGDQTFDLNQVDLNNMVLYADEYNVIYGDETQTHLITAKGTPKVYQVTGLTISNHNGTLTISSGETIYYSGQSPRWAYVPDANGEYATFSEGGLGIPKGMHKVAVGGFAGAFAYNDTIVSKDGTVLNMKMDGDYSEGKVTWVAKSVSATVPTAHDDSRSSTTNIDPPDGINIGDYYYKFSGREATVIGHIDTQSLSNPIPDTVRYNGNTYTVTAIEDNAFKGTWGCHFTSLPSKLTYIGNSAFEGPGYLDISSLPSGVTYIGDNAFANRTLDRMHQLALPLNLSYMGDNALPGYLYDLILQSSPTLEENAFSGNPNNLLNLGNLELTPGSYGIPDFAIIKNQIDDAVYIAPLEADVEIVIKDTSATAGILRVLPVIIIVGLLATLSAYFFYNGKDEEVAETDSQRKE